MTEGQACVQCKALVENVNYTGILCESCYEEQNRPPSTWKDYVSGPSVTGLIGALVPFVFSLTLNGVNFVAAAGGTVAVVSGAVGAMTALKAGDSGKKRLIGSAVVVLLGFVQLFRSAIWLLI